LGGRPFSSPTTEATIETGNGARTASACPMAVASRANLGSSNWPGIRLPPDTDDGGVNGPDHIRRSSMTEWAWTRWRRRSVTGAERPSRRVAREISSLQAGVDQSPRARW